MYLFSTNYGDDVTVCDISSIPWVYLTYPELLTIGFLSMYMGVCLCFVVFLIEVSSLYLQGINHADTV